MFKYLLFFVLCVIAIANADVILSSKVNSAFVTKLNQVASNLKINPNYLMAAMQFESGLNPQSVNKQSQATGTNRNFDFLIF